MTESRYKQLWDDLISKAIEGYLSIHQEFELVKDTEEYKEGLKKDIYNVYENEYKPQFKNTYMLKKVKDDLEHEEVVFTGSGNDSKIDRHKVAALLYLSIVKNDKCPFVKLKKGRDNNNIACISACHEIAYSISLNCIKSFIEKSLEKNPSCPHKNKFLSNGGFDKEPNLICEEYENYRDSIIPRMIWAIEAMDQSRPNVAKMVSTNANMLANIFYFLELHSAS